VFLYLALVVLAAGSQLVPDSLARPEMSIVLPSSGLDAEKVDLSLRGGAQQEKR
jgi:hypothetical protein